MNEFQALACSLSPDQRVERGRELRELARRALVRRAREEGAVVLSFRRAPQVEEALRDLIRSEAECCPFLDFELAPGERELLLRVSAPAGAAETLDPIYESSVQ